MKFKNYLLLGLAITTIAHADPEPTLSCTQNLKNGSYIGQFTAIIDKDGWPYTNFIFTPRKDEKHNNQNAGCVQVDSSNVQRNKIVLNAFNLNKIVRIDVSGNHFISAIGY